MLEERKPFKASDGPMIVLIAFVAMLVGQVVFSILIIAATIGSESADKILEVLNLVAMIAFQGIYLTVYYVYTKRRGIKSSFSVKNKLSIPAILSSVIIAMICIFCFSGLSQLFEFLLAKTGYVPSTIEANGALSIILLVISTVIVAPIGEETIFRAALLSGVERTKIGDFRSCLLSGLIFALMHMNPSQTVYQFCLGASAAYVMLKFRNVIAAMIIHSISNLLAILLSFTDVGLKISAFYVEQIGYNVIITLVLCVLLPIIAVILIWLGCRALKNYEQKKYPDKYKSDENLREGENDFGKNVSGEGLNEYVALDGEKSGFFGKKTYGITLGIYIALTAVLWLSTLIAQIRL